MRARVAQSADRPRRAGRGRPPVEIVRASGAPVSPRGASVQIDVVQRISATGVSRELRPPRPRLAERPSSGQRSPKPSRSPRSSSAGAGAGGRRAPPAPPPASAPSAGARAPRRTDRQHPRPRRPAPRRGHRAPAVRAARPARHRCSWRRGWSQAPRHGRGRGPRAGRVPVPNPRGRRHPDHPDRRSHPGRRGRGRPGGR